MPKGWKAEDHFDFFEKIGRNPVYKKQEDGSLRHETELIVDRGIEFLQNQPKDQPFAMNMWFNACHAEDSDRRPGIGHFPWPFAVNGMYEEDEMPFRVLMIRRSLPSHLFLQKYHQSGTVLLALEFRS